MTQVVAPEAAPRSRTAGDRVRALVQGLGEVLITLGVVVLLFGAYDLFATGVYTAAEQNRLTGSLERQWSQPDPVGVPQTPTEPRVEPAIGTGVAVLLIPALGSDYSKVVVEGVGREDLKRGPGHYPGTAMPGEVGNLVISGHRTTYGAPFSRLDELQAGDPVVVETRDSWFVYAVTTHQIVRPDQVEVTFAVPGDEAATPTRAVLTMITCNPRYSARQRLVVHGDLIETRSKAQGPPDAVRG